MGVAARDGRPGEEEDRADVVVAPPEARGEEARHRDDDHVGDRVRGHHPGHVLQRRPEVAAHVVQRHVHDRRVDQLNDAAVTTVKVMISLRSPCSAMAVRP